MDIELRNTSDGRSKTEQSDQFAVSNAEAPARSSQRLQYEAQTQVIRRQIGGLEEVRLKLGLSARKICQLLLVDPSAWTRWTRDGGDAPPHIWRALQWYMTIQEKIPGLTADYFIGRNPAVETAHLKRELDQKYRALEQGQFAWSEVQKQRIQRMQTALDEASLREETLKTQIRGLEAQTRRMFHYQWVFLAGIALGATILLATR